MEQHTSENLPVGDLHFHYGSSERRELFGASYSLFEAIEQANRINLPILAATNHGELSDYDTSQQKADQQGVILIPGAEIRCLVHREERNSVFLRQPHFIEVLALGITEPIPEMQLPLQDVIDKIHDQDGVAVLPHPWFTSISPVGVQLNADRWIKRMVELGIDGVEIYNGQLPPLAEITAQRLVSNLKTHGLEVAETAGSDGRRLHVLGKRGLTMFNPNREYRHWTDCISAIKAHNVKAVKSQTAAYGPFFW